MILSDWSANPAGDAGDSEVLLAARLNVGVAAEQVASTCFGMQMQKAAVLLHALRRLRVVESPTNTVMHMLACGALAHMCDAP